MSDPITILLPCKEQRAEYLEDALASVLAQSCGTWKLLAGFDRTTSAATRAIVDRCTDPRVGSLVADRDGLGAALNIMMQAADTDYVAILLSDDRLRNDAVERLQAERAASPQTEFFHSGRSEIDEHGAPTGAGAEPTSNVTIDHFLRYGSPVKHLMCWRRDRALAIGGMNEALSAHGCDDYDFPWRMAEAGVSFKAVPARLYEYRIHTRGPRLTTDTPLQQQLATLEAMFASHGAAEHETCRFLESAADNYLTDEFVGDSPTPSQRKGAQSVRYRQAGAGHTDQLRAAGIKRRKVFGHRTYVLPRGGPDGLLLAQQMCDIADPPEVRELLLFADEDALADIPSELFFDDDVSWHRQHLGMTGLVAVGYVAVDGDTAHVTCMYSDIVQRISRRRELKQRVEKRFEGWAHMLVNSIAGFARDAGCTRLRFPNSRLVIANGDASRKVQPELFERVYDRTVAAMFDVEPDGDWWNVDLARNQQRIVSLERRIEVREPVKTVCIIHDTEGGEGHRDVDPAFAVRAAENSDEMIARMLEIEEQAGACVTYNVLGQWFKRLEPRIAEKGHAVAFHSFTHTLHAPGLWSRLRERVRKFSRDTSREGVDFEELLLCRVEDHRTPGYRPPQSRLTPGLADRHLAYFAFEWLASSAWSFGFDYPRMENGVVKVPVHLDDFDLHTGVMDYQAWEDRALALVDEQEITVIGLHDCYAEHWLDAYPALLDRLQARARMTTLNRVSEEFALANTRWT